MAQLDVYKGAFFSKMLPKAVKRIALCSVHRPTTSSPVMNEQTGGLCKTVSPNCYWLS